VSIDGRVQEVIDRGDEADEILRASLAAVHEGARASWSAIAFVEEGQMVIGPVAGTAPDDAPAPALAVPIVYRGDTVAALWLGTAPAPACVAELERAAALLAPYCLVGWDTGGEEWVP
jgi:hypothetical protein